MESILPTGDHRKRPRQHNYVFKKVLYGVKYENITNETRHIALLWSIYIEIVRITHTSKIKKKLHLIRVSVLKLCRPHATKSSLQISMFAWNTYDVYIIYSILILYFDMMLQKIVFLVNVEMYTCTHLSKQCQLSLIFYFLKAHGRIFYYFHFLVKIVCTQSFWLCLNMKKCSGMLWVHYPMWIKYSWRMTFE